MIQACEVLPSATHCDSALAVPTRVRRLLELEHVACCFNHVTLPFCTTLLSKHLRLLHSYVLYPSIYALD